VLVCRGEIAISIRRKKRGGDATAEKYVLYLRKEKKEFLSLQALERGLEKQNGRVERVSQKKLDKERGKF